MDRIIECVANLSEGRDLKVVSEIAAAADSVRGARCVNRESDVDHNRSVLTILGTPEAVANAAMALVVSANARIDLTRHDGVHPRGGVVDVLPFVPLQKATLEYCAIIARQVALRIATMCGVPTRLYGHGELPLPQVRGTGIDTKKGETCVGARDILIAFNVNLKSTDLAAAKAIARSVRERDGGLPAVRALGFPLASKGCVQVSMNLLDYRVTGVQDAFVAVRDYAAALGIEVRESELIGLTPKAAWPDGTETSALVTNFKPEKRIEFWL